jgi:predicted aldo/keto reductase-like oxidoreductase
VLLTKIWPREHRVIHPSGGAFQEFNRFRAELGTDMIDICLVHCAVNDRWAEEYKRIRDELSELKQIGDLRAVGVSCHDLGALKVAARHPWVDVIFARINHMGGREYKMDGTREQVAEVLKTARANGKAVVGMKIFGEGTLVKGSEKDASLRYVWRNNLVDAVTIGMLSPTEVRDSLVRTNEALSA